MTPYQLIIQKFHRDQHALHEQRVQKAARSPLKQNQKMQIQNLQGHSTQITVNNLEQNAVPQEKSDQPVALQKGGEVGQKQGFQQRFGARQVAEQPSITASKVQKTRE